MPAGGSRQILRRQGKINVFAASPAAIQLEQRAFCAADSWIADSGNWSDALPGAGDRDSDPLVLISVTIKDLPSGMGVQ
jgi:hypothetical protein